MTLSMIIVSALTCVAMDFLSLHGVPVKPSVPVVASTK